MAEADLTTPEPTAQAMKILPSTTGCRPPIPMILVLVSSSSAVQVQEAAEAPHDPSDTAAEMTKAAEVVSLARAHRLEMEAFAGVVVVRRLGKCGHNYEEGDDVVCESDDCQWLSGEIRQLRNGVGK